MSPYHSVTLFQLVFVDKLFVTLYNKKMLGEMDGEDLDSSPLIYGEKLNGVDPFNFCVGIKKVPSPPITTIELPEFYQLHSNNKYMICFYHRECYYTLKMY